MICICACSLGYPARKAHAPYYIVMCACLAVPYIFSHYLFLIDTIFGKNSIEYKIVF
jgi:hypothetical protein